MMRSFSFYLGICLSLLSVFVTMEIKGQSCTMKTDDLLCTGSPVEFYMDCAFTCENAVFNFYIDQQLVTTSRIGAAPIPYTFSAPGIHWLYIEYVNSPCGGDFEGSYVEVISGVTAPVISGPSSVCPGGSVTLSIDNPISGVTYQWSAQGGTFTGTGTSVTIPTLNQTTAFSALGTSSATGCTKGGGKSVTVPTAGRTPQQLSTDYYHKEVLGISAGSDGGYYWQTSANGQVNTSANSATQGYLVYEPGDFWLRRYASNCWLPAVGPLHVVVDYTPPAAVVSQVDHRSFKTVGFINTDRAHILKYATYYWVKDASSDPEIIEPFNAGQSIVADRKFVNGVYYLKGRDNGTNTWGPTVTVNVQISLDDDSNTNYVHIRKFDGRMTTVGGQPTPIVLAESRTYVDPAGEKIQSQVKSMSNGKVLAGQDIRDRYQRVVGKSHVAPIGNAFSYKENFMVAGQDIFDYRNFDNPQEGGSAGTTMNPTGLNDQIPGTLGWYYGQNNDQEHGVARSKFPYSRTDFYEDGSGERRRTGDAGEAMRFGTKTESLSGTFPVYNELEHYLDTRSLALPGIVQRSNLFQQGVQTVVRDPQGKYMLTIADRGGRTIMKARGASQDNDVLEIPTTLVSSGDSTSTKFRRLTYFYLLEDQAVTVTGSNFVMQDIVTNEKKPQGQTFAGPNGKWPAGFYRMILRKNSGQVTLSFVNRLRDVSYDFYDDAGKLRTTVTPNGLVALKEGVSYSKIDKRTFKYSFRGVLLESAESDAGKVRYKARRDGNVRFSQNDIQRYNDSLNIAGEGKFAYTAYDHLSRAIQSGEYTGTLSFADLTSQLELTQQDTFAFADKRSWLTTVYDRPDTAFHSRTHLSSTTYKQQFLQGAISYARNQHTRTWYSYNELGRITWVAQKPEALKTTFVLQYEYDFLGDVTHWVSYSYDTLGNPLTEFHHFNEYDADKRLSAVYTSFKADGPRKLRAHYEYYLHGPLKRIELGDELQGIDFIYNIQGWLSQINHPNSDQDPGNDGAAGEHSSFNKDVFGMILNYYESEFSDVFKVSSLDRVKAKQPDALLMDQEISNAVVSLMQPAYMRNESAKDGLLTPAEYSITGSLFQTALHQYLAREQITLAGYEADAAGNAEFEPGPLEKDAAIASAGTAAMQAFFTVNDKQFLVDFGDPATPTDEPGWNNMTNGLTGAVSTTLIDTEGDPSTIQIEIVKNASNGYGNGNFYNPEGKPTGTAYPEDASRDSFFAYGPGGKYKLKGLTPAKYYTLTIFGSRISLTIPNRVGAYTINNQQKTLSAAENLDKTISFHNIKPTAGGEIVMDFGVASGSQFGYINVLTITEKSGPAILRPLSLSSSLVNRQGVLTWSYNSNNEAGFYIDRRKVGDVVFERLDTVSTGTVQYIDRRVSVGNSYEYRMQAFNAVEDSEFSNTTLLEVPGIPDRRFLVDFGNPAFPTNEPGWNNMPSGVTGSTLNGLVDSKGISSGFGLQVIQDASATFAGDGIYYNTIGYSESTLGYPKTACLDSYFAHGNGGSYKLTGLDQNKLYSITIFGSRVSSKNDRTGQFTINGIRKALDAANNSTRTITYHHLAPNQNGEIIIEFGVDKDSFLGYMNVMDFVEVTNPIVETPTSLQTTLVTNGVKLQWADGAVNETGYRVERKLPNETLFTQIAEIAANATTYEDATTLTGTDYQYRVCAVYGTINSGYSNQVAVTTAGSPPDRRYLIDFGSPAYTTQLPGWNNITSAVQGYTLGNIKDSNGNTSAIGVQIVNVASNGFGNGDVFNADGFVGTFNGYPETACRDSYFAYGPGGKYKLKGLNPNRFYSITIFGSRQSSIHDRTASFTINGKQYTLDGAGNQNRLITFHNLVSSPQGELELAFGVAAGSTHGYLGVMDIQETSVPVVIAPSNLVATVEGRFANLAWTDNSANETGFSIERRASEESIFQVVASVGSNITSFSDGLLSPGMSYEYRVVSRLSSAVSAYSNSATVSLTGEKPRRFLLDMGDPNMGTNVAGWNNMTGAATGSILLDMKDSKGQTSTIDFQIVKNASNGYGDGSPFNIQGYVGPAPTLGYPISATRDSYFAHAGGGVYKLKGLNQSYYYTITIFGSRQGTDLTRIGSYIIDGEKQILNAANNDSTLVVFKMLRPNRDGEIVLDFGVETGSQFGYINVMDFTESSIPELEAPVLEDCQRLAGTAGVKLTWTDNTPYETAYEVYRSATAGGLFTRLTALPANTTLYTDASAAVGQTYYYRVRGTRPEGVTPYSNKLISENTGEVPVLAQLPNQKINVGGRKEVALHASAGGNLPLDRKNIVILGSSTAEGYGASPASNSWANLLGKALERHEGGWNLINLGKFGYRTDSLIASGDPERNITKALTYNPVLIIVNIPSNDIADGVPPATFIANLNTIKQAAENAGARVLITTTQPRNLSTLSERTVLQTVANTMKSTYGAAAVDVYTLLVNNADLTIATAYNVDGVHVNNAGHNVIYQAVWPKAEAILNKTNLQFVSTNAPGFVNIVATGGGNAKLVFEPGADDVGTYNNVVISAVDRNGNYADRSFSIQVVPGDPAPPADFRLKPLYNGLVSSVAWRTDSPLGDEPLTGMMLYEYDENYQVLNANWATPNFGENDMQLNANRFRLAGMTYDANGNVKTLRRYDQQALTLHSFDYNYEYNDANSATRKYNNRLSNITGYANQYSYDALGRLTGEDKLEGEDHFTEYDHSGKAVAVFQDAGKTKPVIKNVYDDRGFRLAKIDYPATYPQGEIRTTWYARDAKGGIVGIYEQVGEPALTNRNAINLTEVPVYGTLKIGTLYPAQDSSMAYEITDHVGNVRAIIKDNKAVYRATMEDNEQLALSNPRVSEMQYFENLFSTEVEDANMNHTPEMPGVAIPERAAYLYWIDGTQNMEPEEKAVGPSIALKVGAGDKIALKTWARYQEKENYTNDISLAVIAQFLGTDFANMPVLDGISLADPTGTFEDALGLFAPGTENAALPRAFLNYTVFDKNWNAVASHRVQVSIAAGFELGEEAAPNSHELLSDSVIVEQAGFIYIWVSNGSEATKVWFDDLTVTHTGSVVTQATDYGVWGEVLREQRTDERLYRFGYQGNYAERDEETGWNHFELREYDPVIGRWTSADPKRLNFSPYIGMENNPVLFGDPDGGEPYDIYQLQENGTIALIQKTDDSYDVLLAQNCDVIDPDVAKGILTHNINFKFDDNWIAPGKEAEAMDMLRRLAVHEEKEISGFGFLSKDGSQTMGLLVEPYFGNDFRGGVSGYFINGSPVDTPKGRLLPWYHFHVHPGKKQDFQVVGGTTNPSDGDIRHFRATERLPHVIMGRTGNISLITDDGSGNPKSYNFKRWGDY